MTFISIANKILYLLFFMSLLCILNYSFRIIIELYAKEVKQIIFTQIEIWYIVVSASYILTCIFNGIKLC